MKKQQLSFILFFGALWGLLEATLGYLLQFLPPLVSGSIMFPIGATILIIVYKNTNHKMSVIYVGLIAATIKSINFFMPGLMPIKTYNPMIAIMLQSIAMTLMIPFFDQKKLPFQLLSLSLASLLWRVLFLINITINNALTGFNFPQLATTSTMIQFVFYYGLLGAFILGIIITIIHMFKNNMVLKYRPSYAVSFILIIISLIATYFI